MQLLNLLRGARDVRPLPRRVVAGAFFGSLFAVPGAGESISEIYGERHGVTNRAEFTAKLTASPVLPAIVNACALEREIAELAVNKVQFVVVSWHS
jgi:hypothetical protein